MREYIYLVQEREFIKTNEEIYKIGKSKQENLKRFNSYPKGSELLFQCVCNNCNKIENILIKLFKKKYELQKNIGNEYFKGNYIDMIKDIYFTIFNTKDDKCYINNIELNKDNTISSVNEEINEVKDKKYKCEKCNKRYLTAKFYNEHIKDCNGLNILTCHKCMFTFKTNQSKSNHMIRNNCKPKSIAFANDNYNFTNNITNNYYITNNFEKERLDYITKETIYENCFKACFPILKLIELIHFNNDYPENQNIRYDNKKKIINIKKDNGWTTIDYNYLIYNLFINNSKLLTNYYNDYKDYFDNLINDENHIEELIIYLNHNLLEQIHPKKYLLMNKETKNSIKNFESSYPMN
jgi:hypothetical protein